VLPRPLILPLLLSPLLALCASAWVAGAGTTAETEVEPSSLSARPAAQADAPAEAPSQPHARAKQVAEEAPAAQEVTEIAEAMATGQVLEQMTMEQVVQARGEPIDKEVIPPDSELWRYEDGEVAFSAGKVSYVSLATGAKPIAGSQRGDPVTAAEGSAPGPDGGGDVARIETMAPQSEQGVVSGGAGSSGAPTPTGPGTASSDDDRVEITAVDSAENGAVVPVTVSVAGEAIREIALYAGDLSRLALKATLTPLASPWVSTRVKLRETGDLIVIATTDAGPPLTARKRVNVTGGTYPKDAPRADPHIKLRGKGGTVKILMASPMGATSHIATVKVMSGGQPLVEAETTPWLAHNPYFAFKSAHDVGGRFEVEVALNSGERFTAQTDAAPPAHAVAPPRQPPTITAVSAGQPSFDCAKARSWSEVAVCNDPGLAALDRRVAELYRSTKAALDGDHQQSVVRDQRAWLQEREGCKKQADGTGCLVGVYNARIAQLGGEPKKHGSNSARVGGVAGALTVVDGAAKLRLVGE